MTNFDELELRQLRSSVITKIDNIPVSEQDSIPMYLKLLAKLDAKINSFIIKRKRECEVKCSNNALINSSKKDITQ